MKKNQQGFTPVEGFLAVIVLLLIGFIGFYVYNANKDDKPEKSESTTAVQSKKSATQKAEYRDAVGNYSLTYPADWKVQTTVEEIPYQTDHKTSETTITSPKGVKITTGYVSFVAGLGGACPNDEPNVNQQPDQPTNTCSTYEYLSAESIAYKAKSSVSGASEAVQLVTSRLSNPSAGTAYFIGLNSGSVGVVNQIELTKPELTIGLPNSIRFKVDSPNADSKDGAYAYAYASGGSKAFLSGSDAEQVKAILKTFKFNN